MNLQVKGTDLPPFRPLPQKAPALDVRRKPDGTVYIDSMHPLGAMHRSIAHLFQDRARKHPERNFIGERTRLRAARPGTGASSPTARLMRARLRSRSRFCRAE